MRCLVRKTLPFARAVFGSEVHLLTRHHLDGSCARGISSRVAVLGHARHASLLPVANSTSRRRFCAM